MTRGSREIRFLERIEQKINEAEADKSFAESDYEAEFYSGEVSALKVATEIFKAIYNA
jgi:hypothetical protein